MSTGAPGQTTAEGDAASSRLRRLLRWLPVVVAVAAAAALGIWTLQGGRVLVMTTPSMGTALPAGSVVVTRPLGATTLRRGMIVAFRVPSSGEVYVHRVAQLLAGGRFRTRGDLNASDDGWELTDQAVVGVPVASAPIIGWVLLGLPYALAALAAGLLLALALPRWARGAVRSAAVGASFALPLYMIRPLVRVTVASAGRVTRTYGHILTAPLARPSGRPVVARVLDGGATIATSLRSDTRFVARLVDGGMLPLRVTLRGAHHLIQPGTAGTIAVHLGKSSATLAARAVLPWWGWAIIVAFVLMPVAFGLRDTAERDRSPRGGASMLNTGVELADTTG